MQKAFWRAPRRHGDFLSIKNTFSVYKKTSLPYFVLFLKTTLLFPIEKPSRGDRETRLVAFSIFCHTAHMKQNIIVIIGPTASGKSALAVQLAKERNGEVISADSRQVYKGLNIGTEKITKHEMQGVPHHCLSIASPKRTLSVEQWRKHAEKAIASIVKKGKVPIVAGGSGLYVDALVFGTIFPAVPPNTKLRAELAKKSAEELFTILKTLDPARAKTIEQKNPRRLMRAIEIAQALGSVPKLKKQKPVYEVEWIHTSLPFSEIEERIAVRLKKALRKGLVQEVQQLKESGLSWKRLNELGLEYKIVGAFLRGELPKEQLFETLVREVRRYAKRQGVWLRKYEAYR